MRNSDWSSVVCSSDLHAAKLNALRYILCGRRGSTEQEAPSVVRFLDLSDDANALPETMNSLFTRGFQQMLNPSDLDQEASDTTPSDVENMERSEEGSVGKGGVGKGSASGWSHK